LTANRSTGTEQTEQRRKMHGSTAP